MVDCLVPLAAHHGVTGSAAERGAGVHDLMRAQEVELLQPLLEFLGTKNSVRVLGPSRAEDRAPTVAVELGRNAEAVAAELSAHGIMAGGGDFYAVRALESMGVDPAQGMLRLSFTHYTSKPEIEQLLKGLDAVL